MTREELLALAMERARTSSLEFHAEDVLDVRETPHGLEILVKGYAQTVRCAVSVEPSPAGATSGEDEKPDQALARREDPAVEE